MEIPHQEIENATKACHGLFPKRLVMEAACLFAQRLQVSRLLPSAMKRIFTAACVIVIKRRGIHADYNAFWGSVGGVCDAERHYRLPAQMARKEMPKSPVKNGLNTAGDRRSTLFSLNGQMFRG